MMDEINAKPSLGTQPAIIGGDIKGSIYLIDCPFFYMEVDLAAHTTVRAGAADDLIRFSHFCPL
jgi:hypothetical protein